MIDEHATFRHIVSQSDDVLKYAENFSYSAGDFISASAFGLARDWKATATKIVDTPPWRLFKIARLLKKLDKIEEDLALLIHMSQ